MVVVFDLDDTLYPESDFVRSGFWAVANHIQPEQQIAVYQSLVDIFHQSGSGRVFNAYAEKTGCRLDIDHLVRIYRYHRPLISLDIETRMVLEHVKQRHPTALVSDGPHRMQQNKFLALGLGRYIDFPVFTDLMKTCKPDLLPFKRVAEHFQSHNHFVYVADNPKKDFQAPLQLGWRTIRLKRACGVYRDVPGTADIEIHRLMELCTWLSSD